MNQVRQLQPGQLGLALHTTSPELGLALIGDPEGMRSQTWELGRSLSSQLHDHLRNFLAPHPWSDVAWVGVAKGPGGFTGTRIGVVTARTLAQQLEIPVFPISTLAAIAWKTQQDQWARNPVEISEQDPGFDIAVQMSARRGALFTAVYRGWNPLETALEDGVMTLEEWEKILSDWPNPIHRVSVETHVGESVLGILKLSEYLWQQGKQGHWAEALPFYGQHPVH